MVPVPTRMVKLELGPQDATLARVRKKLNLKIDEVDLDFGLVTLSPERHLYAIVVKDDVADRLEGRQGVIGSYSNPVIGPFGPAGRSSRHR